MKQTKLPTDTLWQEQIKALESYCTSKGWEVDFVTGQPASDEAFPATKKLTICTDRKPEITFYYFLHEIGHMLVCQNKPTYLDKFEAIFTSFHETSQTHKVNRVEEELDAWKSGYKLAVRLGLQTDRLKFEQIKSRCVSSYFMWAVDRKVRQEVSAALASQARKLKNARQRKRNKTNKS